MNCTIDINVSTLSIVELTVSQLHGIEINAPCLFRAVGDTLEDTSHERMPTHCTQPDGTLLLAGKAAGDRNEGRPLEAESPREPPPDVASLMICAK